MIVKEIDAFPYGLVTRVDKKKAPIGTASDMLNFRTTGDGFEQRRGFDVLGVDTADIVGSYGVHTAYEVDGTNVLFRKRGRKLEYYDELNDVWTECGSDIFPVAATDDEASFANYESQAGGQLFVTSPNSSIYKIMVANPASVTDLNSTTYRGRFIIHKNRTFLWDRRDANYEQDRTAVYLSWIDNSKYTTVSAEAVGALGSTAYTYTLVFKAGGPLRTAFGLAISIGGVVKLVDDYSGHLVHVDGPTAGSGTINYTTGEITITLTVPASGNVTAEYQWENSTDEGIMDFGFGSPRAAGEGDVLRQDEGGPIMSIEVFNDVYYCFHTRAIYRLILSVDDTDADNNIFRRGVGTTTHRSTVATGDGIYFMDDATNNSPQVRILTFKNGSNEVVPISRSRQLDLTAYVFDKCWMDRQGDTFVMGCRLATSEVNNRMFVYDEIFKTWDVEDYFSNCGAIYNGTLALGDSLTGNVCEAFSGYDDDDSAIPASWTLDQWDLGYADRLKKCKKFILEGNIGPNQIYDVDMALDDGDFVTVGKIRGDGTYVDRSQRVTIGPETIGRKEIGGGSDGVEAYHYFRQISLRLGKFQKIEVRLKSGVDEDSLISGIGYFSCSLMRFQDVRLKVSKIPRQYRN